MGTSIGPSTCAGTASNAIAKTTKPPAPKGQERTFPNLTPPSRVIGVPSSFLMPSPLNRSDGNFSHAELAELRPLLGLYGGEVHKRLLPGAANAEYVG